MCVCVCVVHAKRLAMMWTGLAGNGLDMTNLLMYLLEWLFMSCP